MSTYLNDPGSVAMKAKPSGRGLRSPDGRYEAAMRVMDATDSWGTRSEFVMLKLWMDRTCNHKIIDRRDGVTMAEGRGPTERESALMAKGQFESRGYAIG